jgi:hypothetical protein
MAITGKYRFLKIQQPRRRSLAGSTNTTLANTTEDNSERSIRNLPKVDSLVQWLDEFATWPENLQLIVFGCSNHNPGIVFVPVKVADAVGKATVHKQPGNVLAGRNMQ